MKVWFDTEFLEDGNTIQLISIGMVREDGAEFYAETEVADVLADSTDWLRDNVRPHLMGTTMPRTYLRKAIIEFCGPKPELWGYYADYDWVVFCQLFGRMIDLPKGFPMYCRDIKQWCDVLGNPSLPEQEGTEHHALSDARWNKIAWDFLSERSAASPAKGG